MGIGQFFGGSETSDKDLATEVAYRWKQRFKKVGSEKALPELRAEIQRTYMSPEAVAQFNRERIREDSDSD